VARVLYTMRIFESLLLRLFSPFIPFDSKRDSPFGEEVAAVIVDDVAARAHLLLHGIHHLRQEASASRVGDR
jgi:hypothetical protein